MDLEVQVNDTKTDNTERDRIASSRRLIQQGEAWLAKVRDYAGQNGLDRNRLDSSRLRGGLRHGDVPAPVVDGKRNKVAKSHGWYLEIDHSLILKDTKFVLSNIALFDLLKLPENDRLVAMSAFDRIMQNPYGETANAYAKLIVLALQRRYPEGKF